MLPQEKERSTRAQHEICNRARKGEMSKKKSKIKVNCLAVNVLLYVSYNIQGYNAEPRRRVRFPPPHCCCLRMLS